MILAVPAIHFALFAPILAPRTYADYGEIYEAIRAIESFAGKEMIREYPDNVPPSDPRYDNYLKIKMAFNRDLVEESLRSLSKQTKLSVYELKDIKHEGDARGWFGKKKFAPDPEWRIQKDLELRRAMEASQWRRSAKEVLARRELDRKAKAEKERAQIPKRIRTHLLQAEGMLKNGQPGAAKDYARKVLELAPEGSPERARAQEILGKGPK